MQLRTKREAKPFLKMRDAQMDIERMGRKTETTKYRSRQELLDDLAVVIQVRRSRHRRSVTMSQTQQQ